MGEDEKEAERMNVISYNQVADIIEQLVDSHYQLKDFGEGDLEEMSQAADTNFPVLWLTHLPSTINPSAKEHQMKLQMVFADKVYDDRRNEREVRSDMLQVAIDILAWMKEKYGDYLFLQDGITYEPFNYEMQDWLSGQIVTLTLWLPFLSNWCAVPKDVIS